MNLTAIQANSDSTRKSKRYGNVGGAGQLSGPTIETDLHFNQDLVNVVSEQYRRESQAKSRDTPTLFFCSPAQH